MNKLCDVNTLFNCLGRTKGGSPLQQKRLVSFKMPRASHTNKDYADAARYYFMNLAAENPEIECVKEKTFNKEADWMDALVEKTVKHGLYGRAFEMCYYGDRNGYVAAACLLFGLCNCDIQSFQARSVAATLENLFCYYIRVVLSESEFLGNWDHEEFICFAETLEEVKTDMGVTVENSTSGQQKDSYKTPHFEILTAIGEVSCPPGYGDSAYYYYYRLISCLKELKEKEDLSVDQVCELFGTYITLKNAPYFEDMDSWFVALQDFYCGEYNTRNLCSFLTESALGLTNHGETSQTEEIREELGLHSSTRRRSIDFDLESLDFPDERVLKLPKVMNGNETFIKYIESLGGIIVHKSPRNYHSEFCTGCFPELDRVKRECKTVDRRTVKTFFSFFSLLSSRGYKNIFINVSDAFLPEKDKWGAYQTSCKLDKIPTFNIYESVSNVLVDQLKFTRHQDDPCLFYHDQYGIVVTHIWEIAVLSKCPEHVRDLISQHFDLTSSYNPERFYIYELKITDTLLLVGCEDYIPKKFEESFTKKAKSVIRNLRCGPSFMFNYLANPPNGEVSMVTEEHVQYLEQTGDEFGQKEWVKLCPKYINFTLNESQKLIGTLLHICRHYRWDIAHYVLVLQRYINHPSRLTFFCIANLFKFLLDTKELKLKYQEVPKSNELLKINVDIYCYASHNTSSPRSYNTGYFITLNGQHWAFESSVISEHVDNIMIGHLISIGNAMDRVEADIETVFQPLAAQTKCTLGFTVHMNNRKIAAGLTGGPGVHIKNEKDVKLFHKLAAWVQKAHIDVKVLEHAKENPAYPLTQELGWKVRDEMFCSSPLNVCTADPL